MNKGSTSYRLLIFSIILLSLSCRDLRVEQKSGSFLIKEYGKYGFVNSHGETIIPCQFLIARPFYDGLAAFTQDSLWGFIDSAGKIIIEPKYSWVDHFSSGICRVQLSDDSLFNTYIRMDGTIAFTSANNYHGRFKYGRMKVILNDQVCYLDKSGAIVITTNYPHGSNFHDGIGHVWSTDSTVYLDTTGNVIAVFRGMGNGDFSEGLAHINFYSRNFYINRSGLIALELPPSSKIYSDFSDGLARVFDSNGGRKSGFIDSSGKLTIPFQYKEVYNFNGGLAAFKDSVLFGFINKSGEIEIKPQFEQVDFEGFKNGLCWVKQDHIWGIINKEGKFVWKEQFGIEYATLETEKWELDTFETSQPVYANWYEGEDNYPRQKVFDSLNSISLVIDTMDLTVFSDRYFGYKLYILNASEDTFLIPSQDKYIKIIQQAINEEGVWQDISTYINSFCGNSYSFISIPPNHFQIYSNPIYKGTYKTKLRMKLVLNDRELFSNTYSGSINKGQLLNDDDKYKLGAVVWAN